MTRHQDILDTYSSIALTTGRMVEAAKCGDWERLAALEQDCRALVDSLKTADAGTRADALYLQRKSEYIRKVLADDAEIRKFTEPWMTQLAGYLGSARREYRLRRAYESGRGG